ncbi:Protein dopey like protein [Verticillium longisporum]|nr:Protein dopey like protein [Verticillium longisporum]
MANEPASSRRSLSPESSGRDSPLPTRQWRNQLGSEDAPSNDKAYRKYASGVERALTLFETALQEWADYISFLNRLLRALQARHNSITTVPSKAAVAKRLAQCLNPSLPSGVHQKALEVYNYVFTTIGQDGLARDLPLYLPGLASTL